MLQNKAIKENNEAKLALREMAKLAYEMSSHLECGDLSSVGKLLNENWLYKRSLSKGVTSDLIDDMYEAGIKAGALGGKLLGAGAGGFLLFYAEKGLHKNIEAALPLLRKIDFNFEMSGSRIIFNE
jgi:D-glycero-alpha-D-manno-heptose-7-phosphate kinase